MAAPLKAGMPDNVSIGATYTLQVAALDPATGNAVAGVKISNMMLEVENLTGGSLASGLFRPVLIRTATGGQA